MDFSDKIMSMPLGATYLISVGQAGYIIKSASGQLIAIDLYLSNCVERTEGHIGFKRLLPQILLPNEITFDFIVITHPHLDHFDIDSVPEMMANDRSRLFCSVDCKKIVNQTHMEYYDKNIQYVKPGENYSQNDLIFHFVNCDHGVGAPDAVGVVIEVDGKRIYEAGDTCLRLDRTNEILQWGNIDVMIAPINGMYGNLTEIECVELSKAIKPTTTIPCHYGMFASHGGNPALFYEKMSETGLSFSFMRQGEVIKL